MEPIIANIFFWVSAGDAGCRPPLFASWNRLKKREDIGFVLHSRAGFHPLMVADLFVFYR